VIKRKIIEKVIQPTEGRRNLKINISADF